MTKPESKPKPCPECHGYERVMVPSHQEDCPKCKLKPEKPEVTDYKYRKRPVVVEAFQMTKERRWDNSEWPEWLNRAWNGEPNQEGSVWPFKHPRYSGDQLCIGTREGPLTVAWNDYIIQGVQGELYPCKPDIFEATYEKA